MAYVKTVWETGDVITAEKLNNLEEGVSNAGKNVIDIVIDKTTFDTSLDCTAGELWSLYASGSTVVLRYPLFDPEAEGFTDEPAALYTLIYADISDESGYRFICRGVDANLTFTAATAIDRPVQDNG